MKKILLSLLALSSVAQSSEYDALLDSSTAIVDQINTGILLVGAGMEYAHQGDALSDGTLSTTASDVLAGKALSSTSINLDYTT